MNRFIKTASISLDLDNEWSYLKIHGNESWKKYPSYLSVFVPYVLRLLEQLNLSITFFIVGKDADRAENRPYLRMIKDAGHEIGNHSYHHESWIHTYSESSLEEEIARSQAAIQKATGFHPVGFRGPGFSWNPDLLQVLDRYGFVYDASTLPTWIGPLARRYYFMTANLTEEEKKDRSELFGKFRDGLRPVKPYWWKLNGEKQIMEIPVTTIPLLKVPFHLSYLLYLSGISTLLMRTYLNLAIGMCELTGTRPSFLLHPLDLIGGDQLKSLSFFPGMDISSEKKSAVFKSAIEMLSRHYDLISMNKQAHFLMGSDKMKSKNP